MNQPAAAEPHFQEMTRLNPQYAGAWYLLGVARSKRRDYANAVAPLQEAINLLPQFLDPYVELGWVQTMTGKPEEARKSYTTVLEHPSVSDRLLRKLAWCYLESGSLQEAVGTYTRLAGSQGGVYEDWNNLGVAYLRKGDPAAAGKALAQALNLDGNRPEALNNLGLLYLKQMDYERAVASFQQASERAPSYLPPLLNGAVVYGQYLGNSAKAAELIRKYLALGGDVQKDLLTDWAEQKEPAGPAENV
jgi:Flp pilus assembly protein TadD